MSETDELTGADGTSELSAAGVPAKYETAGEPLYGGRHLTKGVLITLVSAVLPVLAALFAMPLLIGALGTERFGILNVVWLVVGYFALVELGIGAALTKIVAEKKARGDVDDIALLTWSAFALLLVLGACGAALVVALAPFLVSTVFNIAEPHRAEAIHTFYLVAFSLPAMTSAAVFHAIIAAHQRFGLISALQTPLGIWSFLGPVAALMLVDSLPLATATVVAAHAVTLAGSFIICRRLEPAMANSVTINLRALAPLLRLGGWMTLSRIVGPIMVYFDRFLIGSEQSMSAVAYYSTPHGLVTRLLVIPNALALVLFPTFSHCLATDRNRAASLFVSGTKAVLLSLYPMCLLSFAFAYEGLDLWLGQDFARNGAPVLRWLTLGVLINGVALVPYVLIQSAGRPDITAKLHMVELAPYLLALWFLLQTHGIEGAAIAWTGRIVVDTAVLFIVAGRIAPRSVKPLLRAMCAAGVGLILMVVCLMLPDVWIKVGVTGTVLALFPVGAWIFVLDQDERNFLRAWLRDRPTFRRHGKAVAQGEALRKAGGPVRD